MNFRPLGDTGRFVTSVGLGSQTVGGLGYGEQDQSESQAAVERYLTGGGRFIDSARGYGTSEIHVGRAIKACGLADDEVVVCSKTGTLHPPCAAADLDVSRFCLQRDWIDVYYVHVPSPDPAKHDKIVDAFCGYRERGLIRHVGLSCRDITDPAHQDEIRGWIADTRVDVIQFPCNCSMPIAADLVAEAAAAGTAAVCRGTAQAGLFDDRLDPDTRFTDTDNDWKAGRDPARMREALAIVQGIKLDLLEPPYQNVIQLSQRWVLDQPGVSAIIAGSGSIEEVDALLAVDHLPPLPDDLAAELVRRTAPIQQLIRRG